MQRFCLRSALLNADFISIPKQRGPPGIASTVEKGGLGTSLVNALAHQRDACVESTGNSDGMRVSITRTTYTSHFPEAA